MSKKNNMPKTLYRVNDKYIGTKYYSRKPINAEYGEYRLIGIRTQKLKPNEPYGAGQ